MAEDWFVVPDIEQFVKSSRGIVYKNFGNWNDESLEDYTIDELLIPPEEEEEFEELLSQNESMVIAKSLLKKQRHKNTKSIRYLLSDDIFLEIITQLNSRLVSNTVQSLIKRGMIESGYDSELDDFIFWPVKDNNEKPETD